MVRLATALSHSIVLATTAYISVTHERLSILERPTQSSIVLLAVSGFLSLQCCLTIPWLFLSGSSEPFQSTLPPQREVPWIRSSQIVRNPFAAIWKLSPLLRRQLLSAAISICLAVETFRFSLSSRQCFWSGNRGTLGFVPWVLICCYYFLRQRETVQAGTEIFKTSNLARYVPFIDRAPLALSAFGLGLANVLATSALAHPCSTYICPSSSYLSILVPLIEALNLGLLCFVLHSVTSIIGSYGRWNLDSGERPFVEGVGYVFITASTILCLGGLVAFITHPMNWQWVFNFEHSYVWSLIWHSLLLTAFVLAAVEILIWNGTVHFAMVITIMTTFSAAVSYAASDRSMFTAPGFVVQESYVLVLCSSLALYLLSGGAGQWENQRSGVKLPKIAYLVLLVLTFVLGWSIRKGTEILDTHPIASLTGGVPSLVEQANLQASAWEKQASSSQDIDDAVREYWRRYRRPPPPGFDAWYKYATARNSVVTDDFDSIDDDLRPFWGIPPAEIRLRTAQVMSDTWNDISEIRIRNGKADLGLNFKPTHRWMLDGILSMIKDFSSFLPDMDLAFNLHDEPRVAVPFKAMQQLEKAAAGAKAEKSKSIARHRWSPNRALKWDPLAELQPTRPFTDTPRINSFSAATVACPPTSAARTSFHWDPAPLCTSCFNPHSTGPFLSNWSLASSPCHQPDLRNLHGFYLSPAAFKISQQLLPIFSQSKVAGFADILYPSPWNYIDKAVYSPSNDMHPDSPFAEKENTLFWRGGTSEGVSRFGTWKGMARQRLVHFADHPDPSTSPRLIENPSRAGKYTYTSSPYPSSALSYQKLSLNISIVGEFVRAWDNDGAAQAAEFSLGPPVDFQHHWQYRYVFDTDGAAFSGRFLPFLQSHSLPFRSGIFRAWYDTRLTAWKHFIPIDIRLHGLMATLEYFAGTKEAGSEEKGGGLEGNVNAGERIAEAGREWAGKVLRKEDMEVYMFRLLLEWGRITDDHRDEIGFTVPVETR